MSSPSTRARPSSWIGMSAADPAWIRDAPARGRRSAYGGRREVDGGRRIAHARLEVPVGGREDVHAVAGDDPAGAAARAAPHGRDDRPHFLQLAQGAISEQYVAHLARGGRD